MKYEEAKMEILELEAGDVVTLSVSEGGELDDRGDFPQLPL